MSRMLIDATPAMSSVAAYYDHRYENIDMSDAEALAAEFVRVYDNMRSANYLPGLAIFAETGQVVPSGLSDIHYVIGSCDDLLAGPARVGVARMIQHAMIHHVVTNDRFCDMRHGLDDVVRYMAYLFEARRSSDFGHWTFIPELDVTPTKYAKIVEYGQKVRSEPSRGLWTRTVTTFRCGCMI